MQDVSEAKSADPPVDRERAYESTKRLYVGAAVLVTAGLAVAGSVDRTAGGVILLTGWIAGILGLHRLGRAGSTPRK